MIVENCLGGQKSLIVYIVLPNRQRAVSSYAVEMTRQSPERQTTPSDLGHSLPASSVGQLSLTKRVGSRVQNASTLGCQVSLPM